MKDEDPVASGLGELRDRLGNVEATVQTFKTNLAENTTATKRIEADTAEMISMFKSWQGAMKVLEVIGKAAKPLAAVASLSAAVGAWWFNLRGGK